MCMSFKVSVAVMDLCLLIISCILISKGCSSVKPLQIQQLQNDMKSYIIWASIETFFLIQDINTDFQLTVLLEVAY
jgi:hypothetical protein